MCNVVPRMPISKELIRLIRELDSYDLRRLRMLIDGLVDPDELAAGGKRSKVTFRQETVRCGKQGCRSCPHGPYWYAYWREDGRLRSRYVGKQLPAGGRPPG